MAPITPFLSEAIYLRLVKPVELDLPESVHHCSWPEYDTSIRDMDLMEEMDIALSLSSAGRAARSQANIKLRQPLSEIVIVVPAEKVSGIRNIQDILKEELNVKSVRIDTDRSVLQSLTVLPVASVLGKKHGRNYPSVSDAIKKLDINSIASLAKREPINVVIDGKVVEVLSDEVELRTVSKENYSVVEENDIIIGVHTLITEDLESEGLARDLVRRIQALRKEADFDIDDNITVYYLGSSEVEEVFNDEAQYIMTETLSDELVNSEAPTLAIVQDYVINGLNVRIGVVKN
jgi:isoleucyl-tRNA synthetase